MPTLRQRFSSQLAARILASREGQAHFLSLAAEAEDSDEGAIFDRLLASVDDDELGRMIVRHQADEKRHAALFRSALERTGVTPGPVSDELKLLPRIEKLLGTEFGRPLTSRTDVMNAYLLLQVIEERAVTQFGVFEPIFRRVDPVIADVFAQVREDEVRHLRYCHAISRRYAPDRATHAAALRRHRAVEAVAFAQNMDANLRHAQAHGFLNLRPGERAVLAGLNVVGRALGRGAPTPFWNEPPVWKETRASLHAA